MRLVLDTDVVVRALRSPTSASARLLEAAAYGRVTLFGSLALALEYEAVCLRPEHLGAAGMTADMAETFLDGLSHLVQPVRINYLWRGFLPDADDDMILEAALNGGVDALVTFNQRHFQVAAAQFGLSLVLPGDILRNLDKM
jgi:predicted nucleic acid-binding protein